MNQQDLENYFHQGYQTKTDTPIYQKLGTEYEKFLIIPTADHPFATVPIFGKNSIESVLSKIQQAGQTRGKNWIPIYEQERLLGMKHPSGENITIEPGGQVELSGAPLSTLEQTNEEIREHLSDLLHAIEPLQAQILCLGIHPIFTPETIPLLDKQRYVIMYEYMDQVGNLGKWMMKASTGVQVNVDYFSIEDLERKFVYLNRLVPFFIALFANSPFLAGKPSGVKSFHAKTWLDTDPYRAGLPQSFLHPHFKLSDYIQWALQAQPYHLSNVKKPRTLTAYSFADLMAGKLDTIKMMPQDWKEHLGMLFPEIRIKNIIEIRPMESLPYPWVMAIPALIHSLVYNEEVTASIETWLYDLSLESFPLLHQAAIKDGIQAEVSTISLQKKCVAIMEMALAGLGSENEQWLLPFFERYTKNGISPADEILNEYRKEANEDIWKWLNLYLQRTQPDLS